MTRPSSPREIRWEERAARWRPFWCPPAKHPSGSSKDRRKWKRRTLAALRRAIASFDASDPANWGGW